MSADERTRITYGSLAIRKLPGARSVGVLSVEVGDLLGQAAQASKRRYAAQLVCLDSLVLSGL